MPQILRAIILMIIGVLFFTFVDIFIKFLSHDLPIGEILIVFGGGTAVLFWMMMVRASTEVYRRGKRTGTGGTHTEVSFIPPCKVG